MMTLVIIDDYEDNEINRFESGQWVEVNLGALGSIPAANLYRFQAKPLVRR